MMSLIKNYFNNCARPIVFLWGITLILSISRFISIPFIDEYVYAVSRIGIYIILLATVLISAVLQFFKQKWTYAAFAIFSFTLGVLSLFVWLVLLRDSYNPKDFKYSNNIDVPVEINNDENTGTGFNEIFLSNNSKHSNILN